MLIVIPGPTVSMYTYGFTQGVILPSFLQYHHAGRSPKLERESQSVLKLGFPPCSSGIVET